MQVIKLHIFVEVFGKTDNINNPNPTNDFVKLSIISSDLWGVINDILPHSTIFFNQAGPNKWTHSIESE